MQRLPLSFFAFVPFFVHGIILQAKAHGTTSWCKESKNEGSCKPTAKQSAIHLVQTSAAKVGPLRPAMSSVLPIEKRQVLTNRSTNGTHYLDVHDAKQKLSKDHAAPVEDLEGHPPNATHKPVALKLRRRPIENMPVLADQSTNGTHHLNAQDVMETPTQDHASLAKGLKGLDPNATHGSVGSKVRRQPIEKMLVRANQSTTGAHHMNVQDVMETPSQYHISLAKGLEGHLPNTTDNPVALRRRIISILAARNNDFPRGTIIIAAVICICVVLICVSIIDERQGDDCPPRVRQSTGVPPWNAALQRRPQDALQKRPVWLSRRVETPLYPFAAAPHGFPSPPPPSAAAPPSAIGNESNDIQTVGHSSTDVVTVGHGTSVVSTAKPHAGVAATPPRQGKPDPMCPDLLLNADSWYAIEFASIARADGPISIYGREQKLLLTAYIHHSTAGAAGSVTLALMMGDGQGPCVGSITDAGSSLTLHDKHKRLYGEIVCCGKLAFSLRCDGAERVRFNTDEESGAILLVNPYDGTYLARAAETNDVSDLPSLTDHLGISVVGGMDPALTILCIIGLMAFTQ